MASIRNPEHRSHLIVAVAGVAGKRTKSKSARENAGAKNTRQASAHAHDIVTAAKADVVNIDLDVNIHVGLLIAIFALDADGDGVGCLELICLLSVARCDKSQLYQSRYVYLY